MILAAYAARRTRLSAIAAVVVAVNPRIPNGSFGWSGAYGTHFWVDPVEEIVAVMMIQTPIRQMRPEFENAVMQAIVQ